MTDHKVTHFMTDRINRRLEPVVAREMGKDSHGLAPTPQRGDRTCDCWVASVPDDKAFGIRNGAHNPACPVFRPSRDPVDNLHDAEQRAHAESG